MPAIYHVAVTVHNPETNKTERGTIGTCATDKTNAGALVYGHLLEMGYTNPVVDSIKYVARATWRPGTVLVYELD